VPIAEYPEQAWEDVLRVNLTGLFLMTREVLQLMIPRRSGSVINVSSGVGKVGRARWGAYAVSKFGLEGFSQMVAEEVKEFGIRCNAVNPGPTRTDMRAEAWGYEYQIHYYGNVLSNAERAVDALTGKAPLADEALLISAFRATQYNENVRRRATYDELTSTGAIGLIRDQALRETAMRLYNTNNLNNIVQDGRASLYRKAFRMDVPNDAQRSLEKECGDRVAVVGDYKTNFTDAINYSCSPGLPEETIAASVAALRGDPELIRLLRLRVADLESNVANLLVYEGDIHTALREFTRGQQ